MTHSVFLAIMALVHVPVDTPIVFTNVNVLPMDSERVVPRQSVVIEGGIITRLGPAASIAIPRGALTIDGTGKYLMPGLVDVHVHLASNPENEQRQILKLFLVNGVTTVVNLRGIPEILALRKAVSAGRITGPRIYTAGPYVNEPFVTTPDEVERAVVEQKRAGYDFIKLHGSLSRAAYARLNAVARRVGIRVVGHAPRNLGVEAMFEERQYMVAHAEEFLYDTTNSSKDASLPGIEARLPEFARPMANAGIWLTPNLTAYKAIALQVKDLNAMLARPEMRYLPISNQRGWGPGTNPYTARFDSSMYPGIMARYRILEKLVREFRDAGVRLLVGTDAMNTGVIPGFSAHDEMADLVSAGLTPYQALRAATANAADFLAKDGDRGTVAAGQKADLVLLDANPLENIANTRRIAGVMARGRWLSSEAIAKILQELAVSGEAIRKAPSSRPQSSIVQQHTN
jgi:imidazolonepropionase-like amidohydrolase